MNIPMHYKCNGPSPIDFIQCRHVTLYDATDLHHGPKLLRWIHILLNSNIFTIQIDKWSRIPSNFIYVFAGLLIKL